MKYLISLLIVKSDFIYLGFITVLVKCKICSCNHLVTMATYICASRMKTVYCKDSVVTFFNVKTQPCTFEMQDFMGLLCISTGLIQYPTDS